MNKKLFYFIFIFLNGLLITINISNSYAGENTPPKQCEENAKANDPESLLCLAKFYLNGVDPINALKGIKYAERAAELGNVEAMAETAYKYEGQATDDQNRKNHIPRDCEKSEKWYRKAAALGNQQSIDRLSHEDWGFGCDGKF